MFGRRTPVVAATKSELLVATPNSTFWEYDEQVLRLTNSALDAELSLSDTALASDDWDHLPAVEAICRAGNVACSFTIRRRQVEFASEREGDDAQYMTWWCLDYGDAIARGSGSSATVPLPEVDPQAWRHFDRALDEGLTTFTRLMPKNGTDNPIQLAGGRIGSFWLPSFYRTIGPDCWYPYNSKQQKAVNAQAQERTNVPPEGWQFEEGNSAGSFTGLRARP